MGEQDVCGIVIIATAIEVKGQCYMFFRPECF